MDAQARAIKAALTEWFEAREPREKRLLGAAAAVLLVAFIYSVLWEPAYDGRAQIAASLPLLQGELADVRAQADEVTRLRTAAAIRRPAGVGLRDALAASLAQTGIVEMQFSVIGKTVQVDGKHVPFDAWMTWLDQVRRTVHVRVVNAHATGEAQQGRATVSANLQPASDQ